jgi:glyoxylase I family protein
MFKGIEHTAIASPEPRKLAQWYVDRFGFVINLEIDGNTFVKAPNGAVLEFIPSKGERGTQEFFQPGIRHLAIWVDDFDAAAQKLKEYGVTFLTDVMNRTGYRLLFFTDPEGNILHIVHREKALP